MIPAAKAAIKHSLLAFIISSSVSCLFVFCRAPRHYAAITASETTGAENGYISVRNSGAQILRKAPLFVLKAVFRL
jgi:aldehyde:ferredoxin oxidoreductase